MPENGTGLQLLVDGTTDMELTADLLNAYIVQCAEAIGMTIIFGPVGAQVSGEWAQAQAIIAESHIMAKWLAGGALFIDVFSCFAFDVAKPVTLATEMLGLIPAWWRTLERVGLDLPENTAQMAPTATETARAGLSRGTDQGTPSGA